ncbi:MAG: hypothetical protein M9894_17140 [Planctomycetes bacterium]|nr:hypothetical protein [Planctomycetota bacterium]
MRTIEPEPERGRPDVQPLVDASDGEFYALGMDFVARPAVVSEVDPVTGQPVYRDADVGRWDPRTLRFHDLQKKTPSGAADRRLTFQVYNDKDAEYQDARAGDAPYGQPEGFTALNRSTREVDGAGRVALPCSQRWVVDSEDGRNVLALKIARLGMSESSPPPGMGPDDAGPDGLPEGMVIGEKNGQRSVSFVDTGGAVTFFGDAAVRAALDAIAAGGSKHDAARWASAAARNVQRPPLLDAATRERAKPPEPDTNPEGGVSPLERPEGYVTDGRRHGRLDTFWTVSGTEKSYFLGGEGTPIGPVALRHDAHVSMGPDLNGRIRFESSDASQLRRGARLFKGSLMFDRSLANQDTEVGLEDGQWVVVVGVDADLPPSGDPPPYVDPMRTRVRTPEGSGGSGGGPRGGGPGGSGGGAGGSGSGSGVGEGHLHGVARDFLLEFSPWGQPAWAGPAVVGSPPSPATTGPGATSGQPVPSTTPRDPRDEVFNPGTQRRNMEGEGAPCGNAVGGRFVEMSGLAADAAVAAFPSVQRVPGGVIDWLGYPGLTPLGNGKVAVGGIDPRASAALGATTGTVSELPVTPTTGVADSPASRVVT